ncbi:unnamed protein product [Cochlearia groenlandica]
MIEGGRGRGLNIWDGFTHRYPEKGGTDMGNGDNACESYTNWQKDVDMMSKLGVNGYRFSFAWSRLVPRGKVSRGVNPEGLKYYHGLVDALIAKNITSHTLCLPMATQRERMHPVDALLGLMKDVTEETLEPNLISLHITNFLLMPPLSIFIRPNISEASAKATERIKEFFMGWFMEPLTKGRYPDIMRQILGNRLPSFTEGEAKLVQNSFDFIGLNYYLTQYAQAIKPNPPERETVVNDSLALIASKDVNGDVPGPLFDAKGHYYYPKGIYYVMDYFKRKYNNPLIYITENGISTPGGNTPQEESMADYTRIDYLCSHLCFLLKAIKELKVNVRGYFAWSLGDNYEFGDGFTVRFGLSYVDFNNVALADRELKASGLWYQQFLNVTTKETGDKYLLRSSLFPDKKKLADA